MSSQLSPPLLPAGDTEGPLQPGGKTKETEHGRTSQTTLVFMETKTEHILMQSDSKDGKYFKMATDAVFNIMVVTFLEKERLGSLKVNVMLERLMKRNT